MDKLDRLSSWSTEKTPWLILFATALALEIAALVFQHAMEYAPCVMCIYQRTAVLGVVLAGFIVVVYNSAATRLLAYAIWAVSTIWGAMLSWEHIGILNGTAGFAPCALVPNFPSFLPLHEWLPFVFAADGYCEDDSWQFLGMGMAKWLFGIFIAYGITCFTVVLARILTVRKP